MQPKFEVYPDAADQWRWRLLAGNGQIVAVSGESFTSPTDATRATQVVRRISTDAPVEQLAPEAKPEPTKTTRAMDKLKAGRGRQEIEVPASPDPKVPPAVDA